MSQIGSITAEKEKQMALERQKFQEAKAKMLAQQKYKRAARITGHIALNIVVALIVLLPLLYAISIAFMPSSELFTLDLNILPKHPTLENFRQALQKVPLVRFVINSLLFMQDSFHPDRHCFLQFMNGNICHFIFIDCLE